MIGIGIDTGGTYTDAVVYDLDKKQLLSSGKSLTTKENLETGILNAIGKLSPKHIYQADFIALSTTLATNACVEGKGGRAKLMLIGVNPASVNSVLASYGLPSPAEIYFLAGDPAIPGDTPDWDAFSRDIPTHFAGYDSVAIVQIHPKRNSGEYEKKAYELLTQKLPIPCILGYELFHDPNVLRRGTSALLNARLLPVMENFFVSIEHALKKLELTLPIVVVRSDGSLMSREFACKRPVETLLCGPAASILGSIELTEEKNGIVVDMGGTTSDISIFKDNIPVTVKDGIQIGNWKTFVKGLYVDTFGLGGDSAVRYPNKCLCLDNQRVIPLCNLATQYPSVLPQLEELNAAERRHTHFLHEFYVLVKKPVSYHLYTKEELAFCKALEDGPLILEKAAATIGQDIYTFNMSRLENEGIVMRSGLTPTDVMHLRGDFDAFDTEASRLGAAFVCRSLELTLEEFCTQVYSLVRQKLYVNLGRILLQFEDSELYRTMGREAVEALLAKSYGQAIHGVHPTLFQAGIQTDFSLIGIGAPIHLFVKDVAKLLGTNGIVPNEAPVANALGAVSGNVIANFTIDIEPVTNAGGIYAYRIVTEEGILTFGGDDPDTLAQDLEEARQAAIREASKEASKEARKRGAKGELAVSYKTEKHMAALEGSELFLKESVTAKAVGKIFLT